jgi:hypothetical protein
MFPQNSILQLLNCFHSNLIPKHGSRVSNSNDGWNVWRLQTFLAIITSKHFGPLPTLRRIRTFLFKDVEDGVWWGFWFQLNNCFVVWNIQVLIILTSNMKSHDSYHLVGSYQTLLEILSFATSHYATSMQLIVICNYLGHVCNYKFGIV